MGNVQVQVEGTRKGRGGVEGVWRSIIMVGVEEIG
jgi:hypothetical protein